jgi:NAD-dependent DNA ligase
MLSLTAAQDAAAMGAWAKRLGRLGVDPEGQAYVIEPKVDGLAVRAVYR